MSQSNKIIVFSEYSQLSGKQRPKSDIIKTIVTEEEKNMTNNSYTKNEIDLKMELIERKIDNKFDVLSAKIDSLPLLFENALLKNNELLRKEMNERQEKSTNNLKWFIGIIITIMSIASPYIQRLIFK